MHITIEQGLCPPTSTKMDTSGSVPRKCPFDTIRQADHDYYHALLPPEKIIAAANFSIWGHLHDLGSGDTYT